MATPKRRRNPGPAHGEDTLVASLIAQMEAGTTPWRRPWDPQGGGHHVNLLSGRAYRGSNPILLSLGQHRCQSSLPYWCGYVEAQSLGLAPRRGCRGVHILRPQAQAGEGRKPKAPQEASDPSVSEPKVPDQRTSDLKASDDSASEASPSEGPTAEISAAPRLHFRPVIVFNAADLEGDPEAKERLRDLVGQRRRLAFQNRRPESDRLNAAESILATWPVPVEHGGDQACYQPQNDRILLPLRGAFHSAAAFCATWAHEAIHSTGHPSRLNRNLAGAFGSDAYAREELVAELGAVLLGDRLEIGSPVDHHAAYLGHWIHLLKATPALLYRVLGEARRAADLIAPEAPSEDEAARHSTGPAWTGPHGDCSFTTASEREP